MLVFSLDSLCLGNEVSSKCQSTDPGSTQRWGAAGQCALYQQGMHYLT